MTGGLNEARDSGMCFKIESNACILGIPEATAHYCCSQTGPQCVILATFYIGIGLKMAKLLYLSTVLRSPDQILTPYVVIFLDPK